MSTTTKMVGCLRFSEFIALRVRGKNKKIYQLGITYQGKCAGDGWSEYKKPHPPWFEHRGEKSKTTEYGSLTGASSYLHKPVLKLDHI